MLMHSFGHTLQIETIVIGVEFELKGIGCGVPQGSVLGPLFLHYTLMTYIKLLEKIISAYLQMIRPYFRGIQI